MPKREAVVVIIYKYDQSILLQLRDPFPSIILPSHWGAFGGTVETGEVILDTVYRELWEELHYEPQKIQKFRKFTDSEQILHVFYCKLELPTSNLVLGEGVEMALFSIDEILSGHLPSKKKTHL